MDSKKIGNLIYELRNKNHLTQKELANRLLVTSQAVSKWENGRGIPDIEMLQKLSEIFEIDISELLTGSIKEKQDDKKGKTKKIGLALLIVGMVVLFTMVGIMFITSSSNSDFQISKLASDNELFRIKGIIAYNNNKKSIYISKVDYAENEEEKEYLNVECVLYEVSGNIEKRISTCNSQNSGELGQTFTLSELLENIELNVDNYSCSCEVSACNQLYLKINAINKKGETVTYNIPIELENSCVKES